MSWQSRIDLSRKILKEIADLSENDEAKYLLDSLEGLNNYLESDMFKSQTDAQKECDTLCLFTDIYKDSLQFLEIAKKRIIPQPPVFMSIEEAKQQFYEYYMKASSEESDELALLSIDDWMEDMCIVIEEKSSSSSEN